MVIGVYAVSHHLSVSGAFGYVLPDVEITEPTFSMGAGTYATSTETINGSTYLTLADPTADTNYIANGGTYTTTTEYTSLTVNGTTIYCPVVQIIASDGKTNHGSGGTWYSYFPVFSNATTIKDNLNTYDSTTQTMPSSLSVWGRIVDGVEVQATPQEVFDYGSGNSDGSATPQVANDILVYSSALNNAAKSAYSVFVKFQYTAQNGTTYYYYICYYAPAQSLCITAETLITLSDGSQKMAKDLDGTEELLVLNHNTGKLESAKIAYIYNYGYQSNYEITKLKFSNGSTVEIYGEHVFYDVTLNKYIPIRNNPEQFIGHQFVGLNIDIDDIQVVTLVGVEYECRVTTMFEVVTYQHLTCFTENILSASAFVDRLLNIFEINTQTFAYDAEQVQQDIQTYGLYTYEDFKDLLPEVAFDMYNAKHLKVAVGKGYITWDDVLELVYIYHYLGIQPLI